MNYYYRLNGQTCGPCTAETMQQLYAVGTVTADTPVAVAGADAWTTYASLFGSVCRAAPCDTPMGIPLRTVRFVLSIISLLLGLYLLSKASTIYNIYALASVFGLRTNFATGYMLGFMLLASGVLGVCMYIRENKVGVGIAGVLCFIGILFSLNVGPYVDLYFFDALAFIVGLMHILPCLFVTPGTHSAALHTAAAYVAALPESGRAHVLFELRADSGERYGVTSDMVRTSARLGRSRDCELVFRDSTVSAHHARLCYIKGRAGIADSGSSGGTFVNGRRLSANCAVRLHRGDTLVLGRCKLTVR